MKTLLQVLFFSLVVVLGEARELDQHAKAIELPLPDYPVPGPYEADSAVVSVVFAIDTKGEAKVVRVMSSSSYRFAEAVRRIAPHWTFAPGRRDGEPSTDVLEFILFFAPKKAVEIVGPLYET